MMPDLPYVAVWFVTAILVVAAVIDGWMLKVPNWLTFPLVLSGLTFWAVTGGLEGALWSFKGLGVGLAVLLALYAIGGMGAGDVKLFGGVGAWVGPAVAFQATLWWIMVGGLMAAVMIIVSRDWRKHVVNMQTIAREVLVIRDPVKLSEVAAARKPSMMLLPYGIPIAVGSIGYFAWSGLLFP
ncbi:MAG: A24 family peptidase [Isosphaeraceae bacterium]